MAFRVGEVVAGVAAHSLALLSDAAHMVTDAAAIGLAIAYWVVAGIFNARGNVNTVPAFLAAWSPDLLFGIAGAYLLLRSPT